MSLDWFQKHTSEFEGDLRWQEPMASHTYYRIGGPVSLLCIPSSVEDLSWIAKGLTETASPYFVMGSGSNLLVSDAGFTGVVIKMSKANTTIVEEESLVRTGSGVAVSSLLRKAGQMGWSGLEFLTGVPGSMGGVAFMNAGTHLGEAVSALAEVEVFSLKTGERKVFSESELKYSYRKNHFLKEGDVVVSLLWRVKKVDPVQVQAKIKETLDRRKSSQPIEFPSCGSVFKNPREMRAWEVLDRLGLRGARRGNAQFSEKHPNFIVNHGKARATDVVALISEAKTRAKKELGVQLEEEVRYLGF